MGLLSVALLLSVIVGFGVPAVVSPRFGAPALQWSLGGVAPLEQHRGNVTIVSLVQANCASGRKHVELLGRLHLRLLKLGLRELSIVGVNSKHQMARLMLAPVRQSVSFNILQDTHQDGVWTSLGGYKDDVFIYDGCGRLTAHIPYPKSHVTSHHVEAAIMWTYFGNPCGANSGSTVRAQTPKVELRPQNSPSDEGLNVTLHKCHRPADEQTRKGCHKLRRHHTPQVSKASSSTLCWCLPGAVQRTCACSCASDANENKPVALLCTINNAVVSSAGECESGARRLYEVCRCERSLLPVGDGRGSVANSGGLESQLSSGQLPEGTSASGFDLLMTSGSTQIVEGGAKASVSLSNGLTTSGKRNGQEQAATHTNGGRNTVGQQAGAGGRDVNERAKGCSENGNIESLGCRQISETNQGGQAASNVQHSTCGRHVEQLTSGGQGVTGSVGNSGGRNINEARNGGRTGSTTGEERAG